MVVLVYVDLVGVPDFEPLVPVEVALVAVEVAAVVLQMMTECGCTRYNPVGELGYPIATRKCLLV